MIQDWSDPQSSAEEVAASAAAPAVSACTPNDLMSLVASSGDVVVQLDREGRIQSVMGNLFADGVAPALQKCLLTELASVEHAIAIKTLISSAVPGFPEAHVRARLNQFSSLDWVTIRVAALPAPTGGYLAIVRDESAAKTMEDKLQRYAARDVLTNLPNRLLFSAQVRAAIGQKQPFAVLSLDIDEFKKINSSLGVTAGDALLRAIAQRLSSIGHGAEVVARTSGDEFSLLLKGDVSPDNLKQTAKRILVALRSPFVHNGKNVHISVSAGAARYPVNGETVDVLVAVASEALHNAKHHGPGLYVLASENAADRNTNVEQEAAMFNAVQMGEFHLDYQPLVSAKSGKIQGFEALMRWTRANGQRISPAEFIPIAEKNGLINLLGSWALKAACTDVMALQEVLGYPVYVSVNVSPVQFRSGQLMDAVTDALKISGIPGEQVLLEITEGALMSDPEGAQVLLEDLVALNVRIAIDDFGTGYSSLAYLQKFPISILKVDRAFIKDLPANTKDDAICRAVIGLADLLNLTTVAEGVETQEQLDILKNYGCETIQGYHTGRPSSRSNLTQQLTGRPPNE